MAEFFGDLERLAADLYPYRWLIAAGLLVVIAATATFGYRRGWHDFIWRHRLPVVLISVPLLALVGFVGWDLGSPLVTNKTVEEEFPFAFTAVVPEDMDREDVEAVMDVIAKVDEEPMDDPMPEKMEKPEEATKEGAPGTAVAQTSAVKLKVGSFRDQDSFHKGSGQGTIYRALDGSLLLRLEDFKVTNGPDLHVFLSPHPNPGKRDEVKATGYVDLGKLKGNRGNQNYPIPDEVNLAAIESIVIYCVPFHVIFSVASLETVVESLEALVPPPEAEEEEFPRASTAIVPPDMEREEVEKVMDIMAKVDQEPMDDPMPEEMAVEIVVEETVSKTTPVAPTPISTPTSVPTATPTPVGQADQPVEPSPTPAPAATPTPQPSPVTAAQGGAVKLKTGDFHDQDAFHKGSGQATIYRGPDGEHLLRLENLDVTNGPDLHVILTPNRDPKSQGDVKNTGWVDLGKLKGNRGNQNYPIPDDVDIAIQGSVVIYCKPFHVIFSVAPLEDVN